MRSNGRLGRAVIGFLPLPLTVLTLAPLAGAFRLGTGVVVLGAAVCLTGRHRPGEVRTAAGSMVRVLTTTVGVALLGLLFSRSLVLGDLVFLAMLTSARLANRYGPRWAELGRAMLLPLTALFIAPPVHVSGGVAASVLWAAVACLVATLWTLAVPAVLRRRSDDAPATTPDPADGPSARTRTRMALQSSVAVALALLSGQLLFPEHWPWTVLTVLTVSLAARSRGEVMTRSWQRLAGALIATAVASPAAALLAQNRPAMVAVMLAVLAVGWYLREFGYVWWTIAMTATLAFLYTLVGAGSTTVILGERMLAICLGGACAMLPALLWAPRTRDLVRKRAATSLRRLRECLADPSPAAVRAFETAVAELESASLPLRLLRRRSLEAGWAAALASCGPDVRRLSGDQADEARVRVRRVADQVLAEVRATARYPRPRPELSTMDSASTGQPG